MIAAMVALNEELDKSSRTLTSLLSQRHPSLCSTLIFSAYIWIIAWCCARDASHPACIACMAFLSTQIAWLEWLFDAPPMALAWVAYTSFGALLCVCFAQWCCGRKAFWPGIALAAAHLVFSGLGPVVHNVASHGSVVVQLSDLHIGPVCRFECATRMVDAALSVQGSEKVVFVITGDVIDGRAAAYAAAAEPLRRLAQRGTTLMVIGNHDHLHGDVANVVRLMRSFGIIVLRNQAMELEGSGLRVAGVDDLQPNTSLALLRDADLILVHRPSIAAQIQQRAGLKKGAVILAGHTHCGQMLPITPLIWAASYPYFCGWHGNVYVSSGSGQWGPSMRLGYRAEIAVHNVPKRGFYSL